jgi:hypothetical protein
MKKPDSPADAGNVFSATVSMVGKGGLVAELNGGLAEVVRNVRATGKAGELTLKLKVAPATKGEGSVIEAVQVAGDVRIKLPKLPVGASLFYTTEEGALCRNNPNQSEMEFASIDGGKQETGSVAASAVAK